MAHSQGGKAGTTSDNLDKSWNAALGSALQETTLDPGWADVHIEPAYNAGPHAISDGPETSNALPNSMDPNTRHTYTVVKPAIATFAEAPLQATPSSHTERAKDVAQVSANTDGEPLIRAQREVTLAALPAVDTTLHLVPGKGRLASALVEFARANGWEIAWEIERDFPIDYPATFQGPFLDIITSVVGSLHTTDAPIRAKIYHGNKVVRIIHATR